MTRTDTENSGSYRVTCPRCGEKSGVVGFVGTCRYAWGHTLTNHTLIGRIVRYLSTGSDRSPNRLGTGGGRE